MGDLSKPNGHCVAPSPVVSDEAMLLFQLATALKKDGKFEGAAIVYRRGIAVAPEWSDMWNGLGAVLLHLHDYKGSEKALDFAIQLNPADAGPRCNKGLLLTTLHRFDEAEREYGASLAIKERSETRWNMSLCLLRSGDWARGLKEYECRLTDKTLYPDLPYPLWNGEGLDGKTLYVHPEQGIGDVVMASRYLPWIKERWPTCRILFYCPMMLVALLWEFRHIVEFLPANVPPPAADYAVHVMSLPLHYGTTTENVPGDPGLILKRASQDIIGINLSTEADFKIGLAWTGNAKNLENKDRSIPAEMLMELAQHPSVVAFSLQVGDGEDDIERLGLQNIIVNDSERLRKGGFASTAAYIRAMDLVVTVSTSTAHVAGALGIPTLVLLHHDCHWVWGHGRRCVWYPSMTLIRQRRPGNWRPVINEAKALVSAMIDARPKLDRDVRRVVEETAAEQH